MSKASLLRSAIAVLAVLIVTVICSVPAFSQATISTGNIQGVVADQSGAMVSSAKVTITNRATGQKIETVTNTNGAYNSGALGPGNYTIRVEAKGFQTTEMAVLVQVGVATSGNMKLTIGSESTVVEVAADAVRVNTEQPTVQGVLTSREIESLPLAGRNFLDLAQLEPGVQIQDGGTFDPTKNGFSSISFGGRYGRTARISLDGIDVSDETVGTTTQNISAGAISEFQLSQSSLDMSTSLTSSGAVNVVTKSGTNTVHGEGFYLFRDKSLMANFPGGLDTPYQRNHFGGSLGGPIVKDKLFFFANAERIKQDLAVALPPLELFPTIPQSYPGRFRDLMSMGRLDYNLKNAKIFYRFTYESNSDVRAMNAPPTYQPFANRDNTPAHGVGADFTTGTFTHSIRFGFLKFQNHIADAVLGNPGVYDPIGNLPVALLIGGTDQSTRFGPSRLAPQATFQSNYQLKYDGSKLKGTHMLRYGVEYNRIRGGGFAAFYTYSELRTRNNQAAIDFANNSCGEGTPCYPGGSQNPLNYQVYRFRLGNAQGYSTEVPAFGYPAGGQWDNRVGLYFGDTWKIKPNLTLTYGLRWGRDTGRQDSDVAPITCDQIDPTLFGYEQDGAWVPLLPCSGNSLILDQFGGKYGARVRQPNSNFGPMFGFAWDPKNNGKTVIRGGAGLYYENVIFNNILFDRPGRLAKGLFLATPLVQCASTTSLPLPGGGASTFTWNGKTYDIGKDICGQPVGKVTDVFAAMSQYYQQQVAQAGPTANPNFIGNTLAYGNNSTGNLFIAPGYRTPRSYQMNIGIQHEIKKGTVVTADFIRNIGLRYLIGYDTNHVGDARYLNKTAAQNAIAATLEACGVATINEAIVGCPGLHPATAAHGILPATIEDFAGFGLDSGITYNSGFPITAYATTPDFGAAFPGINSLVGENDMLFPIGRSVYTALQAKVTQDVNAPMPGIKHMNLQVSYALSRFNGMALGGDQDFVGTGYDYANPTRYFGPSSLDRLHQLSFGGVFDINHGPRFALTAHFFSPLSVTPTMDDLGRSGEIFFTDLTGDGTTGDIPTGANIGSFGRDLNAGNINNYINKFNGSVAGGFTPAAQALIGANLFTADQMKALGAVIDPIPLAPSDQANLGWVKGIDLKASWPIKIRERFTIEPSVGFYNVFNFANFDNGANPMTGALNATAPSINGTGKLAHDQTRVGPGTGANTAGAPRQIDFGLKITF